MNLKEITENLQRVSDTYAEKFRIRRDEDWFILKIQEELGELSAAHLKMTDRARKGNLSPEELHKNLQDEIGDVLALTLLYAKHRGIDAEKALREKWFQYL